MANIYELIIVNEENDSMFIEETFFENGYDTNNLIYRRVDELRKLIHNSNFKIVFREIEEVDSTSPNAIKERIACVQDVKVFLGSSYDSKERYILVHNSQTYAVK